MDQAAFRDMTPLTEAATLPQPQTAVVTISDSKSAYCLLRAGEEIARAEAATHPAARAAHLELADLYRERMLAGPITER